MIQTLQVRYKALAGAILGFASPLITFLVANQNLTLKELFLAIGSSVITGGVVHQVPNKTIDTPPVG